MAQLTPEQERKLNDILRGTQVWDGGDASELINLRSRLDDLQAQLDAANAKSDHEHELHLAAMERIADLEHYISESDDAIASGMARERKLQDEVQQLRERLAELHELGIMK